jgi:hypothetical protein
LDPKRDKLQEDGRYYVLKNFVTFILHWILLVTKSRMRWMAVVVCVRKMRITYNILAARTEWKGSL